jgi:hypothetical protein
MPAQNFKTALPSLVRVERYGCASKTWMCMQEQSKTISALFAHRHTAHHLEHPACNFGMIC